MRQAQETIEVRTRGRGMHEITAAVGDWLARQSIARGMLTVFCQHTSASLTIQENADADVQSDLEGFFQRIVPEDPRLYRHTAEGADDMPAHIRSALTGIQVSIPVSGGRLALGTWQGLYLFEHRARPHTRRLVLHLFGE